MKRFIVTVLSVSVFFVGLGAIAETVGAKFKSDQKALEIIAKARQAIGGDAALAEVRSMVIIGRTTHTFKIDGQERAEQGESEIALQFPDKMTRIVKIGQPDGSETGERHVIKQHDVVVVGSSDGKEIALEGKDGEFTTSDGKKIVIRRSDGSVKEIGGGDGQKIFVRKADDGSGVWTSKEGKDVNVEGKAIDLRRSAAGHGAFGRNDLLRTTLSLLLTAPEGLDVEYGFVGESTVDGVQVNIVSATAAGASFKLYIDRFSNMPVGMSYDGDMVPMIVRFAKDAGHPTDKDAFMISRKLDTAAGKAESFVRFADFRSTNGIQLPFRWTTTIGGGVREVFEVTSYELNPANIADKFDSKKITVRVKQNDGN